MNNYEINDSTMAVIALDENKSKIIEKDNEYIIDQNSYEIMDFSCQYFGSSYQGRQDGSRYMLGSKYKPPIVVEESKEMIFFPTISPLLKDCSWISLKSIKSYENIDDKVKLILKNDQEIILNISYYSLENQILRATRLESILRQRKNN